MLRWKSWNSESDEYVKKVNSCDDFQLTDGQCEFRDPHDRVSGISEIFPDKVLQDYYAFMGYN